jgi:hypothetical protein
MKKVTSNLKRKKKPKKAKSPKKPSLKRPSAQKVKIRTRGKVKTKRATRRKTISKQIFPRRTASPSQKEIIEKAPLTAQKVIPKEVPSYSPYYTLPVRYGDNRIILLPRDPWWIHTYWDISEDKINEVISSIPVYERQNLKWVLRIYDVSGVVDFRRSNANSFFDIDINFEAGNWYINVNQPEREWCVEIGFKNSAGIFFPIECSNIVKTPCFGISPWGDEEWLLPDEEYFKILGLYDLGKSSLERRKRIEEIFRQQISSPLASWGISSLFSEKAPLKDKFFLEVWTELILYGKTQPGSELSINNKKIKLGKDGTFSLRYALPEGDFKFSVIATSKNKKHKIKKVPAVKRYSK